MRNGSFLPRLWALGVVSLFLVSARPVFPEDFREPDSSFSDAVFVTHREPLVYDYILTASLDISGDRDFYYFGGTSSTEKWVSVWIQDLPDGDDYQDFDTELIVYDGSLGTVVASNNDINRDPPSDIRQSGVELPEHEYGHDSRRGSYRNHQLHHGVGRPGRAATGRAYQRDPYAHSDLHPNVHIDEHSHLDPHGNRYGHAPPRTPSFTPRPSPTCSGSRDPAGNGKVDAVHLIEILRRFKGRPHRFGNPDINCDGVLDPRDLFLILRKWNPEGL